MRIHIIRNLDELRGIISGFRHLNIPPGPSGYYKIETSRKFYNDLVNSPKLEIQKYWYYIDDKESVLSSNTIILYGAKITVIDEVIDCRSEEGITIGLIDATIAVCRVLAPRLREADNHTSRVRE